ncbi:MAG: twin-arginine translocase TatA/TatE family subunit [Planctomycetes bacterium]|nr:twin-arginine translocase TatA/TatE family subunit [Planctomycetota bacterium]
MFGIGTLEILIVLAVVLLLFGNRLPGTMRSLGRSLIEFKRGLQGADETKPAATVNSQTAASKDDKVAQS